MKQSFLLTIFLSLLSFPSYGITLRELGNTVELTIQSIFLYFLEIIETTLYGDMLDLHISQLIILFIVLSIPIYIIGMIFGYMDDVLENYCKRKNLNYEKIRGRTLFLCWIFLFVGLFSIIIIFDP